MMTEVRCSQHIPEVSGLPADQLTVGRHFILSCEGTWDRDFDFSKAQFILNEQSQHILKVLKAEVRDINSFDVEATGYVAGQLQIPDLKITDGSKNISLGSQQIKIETVLEQPAQQQSPQTAEQGAPQKPQPYGYIWSQLTWPWVYSLTALILVLVLLSSALYIFLRGLRWRRIMKSMDQYSSAVAPDIQYYKEIRRLEKKDYPIDAVAHAYKLYIVRSYQVPLFQVSAREATKILKKKWPRLKTERRQIFNSIKDLDLLQQKNDFDKRKKMVEQTYRLVDRTEELKAQGVIQ